jgi:hypothetical protein
MLLLGLNALALICMYLYFKGRIDKRLESERLLEELRSGADRMVRDMIQELNRVTVRSATLIEGKAEEVQKILDKVEKGILLVKRELKNAEIEDEKSSKARTSPPVKASPPAAESLVMTGKDQVIFEIVDLHRKGISPDLIANKLDLPVGEVEMMIALQDRKGRN